MTDQYKLMRHLLSDRIVAFHPSLALALGGVNEALIFQQIAYWTGKGADPEWVYKTRAEFYEETTLTRTQQENARKNLRRLGVIEEERRGLPARIYFRINWDVLFRLLSVQSAANLPTSRREARQPVGGKPTDLSAGLPPTSKSTSESIKDEDWSEPKMPRTLEELDEWERRMEERRRWIKGIDRSAD